MELGFIEQHSQATLEDDFNAIAGELFMGDARFWELVALMPKIRAKVNIAITFYSKIDPSFSESYFRSLVPVPSDSAPRTSEQVAGSSGVFTDEQIDAMSIAEAQAALSRVDAARKAVTANDAKRIERLRHEFQQIIRRIQTLRAGTSADE